MTLSFVVLGDPVPKQMVQIVGGRRVKPGSVAEYESRVRLACMRAMLEQGWETSKKACVVIARFYVETARTRDLDNLLKATWDGLKRAAFRDDVQVVEVHAFKGIDRERPRVELEIREAELTRGAAKE